VESKWKNYYIIIFPGWSLSKNRDPIYARCFLWRQNYPEVNYSPNRISGGGSVSRGNVMQALRQETVQRAEGTSQLQDWNMECKDLKSRRQIGESENGNAEE